MFDIIIEYPDSLPAIYDLKVSIRRHAQVFSIKYIHLVLAVVVYFDFSPLLQESLEVTDQRKELIVDLRTAYVYFLMWLCTHHQ